MAELSFIIIDTQGRKTRAESIVSYALVREASAPCDGLRLTFQHGVLLGEISAVEAYKKSELVFSGLCDTQRETATEKGYTVFIYARSNACLLVDNEAQPGVFDSPSARAMYEMNVKKYGFDFCFDDVSCDGLYLVKKGSSCYSAVNSLVKAHYGRNVVITPDNRLTVPSKNAVLRVISDRVVSEKRIVNRGSVISQLDYKTSGNIRYVYHIKSRSFERSGIKRSKKVNLSALPDWQRKSELKNMLSLAAKDYRSLEIVLEGVDIPELYASLEYDSPSFEDLSEYRISSVSCVCDRSGERTTLKLNRESDLEEIMYVD